MKKLICVFIVVILVLSVVLCAKHKQDVLFAEEIQKLQEEHPQYFGLDTSEGLNVLVYGDDKIGFWSIRLVPGNKDYYSIYEDAIASKTYEPLSLEEAKMILAYYDLPDEMVVLRPYDNWLISSYKLSHLLEDETYLPRMAEAFDNRYQVGEAFPVIYVPEIDVLPPEATAPPTTEENVPSTTETTAPLHSELYIPDIPVETVLEYFNEVVLAAEFINSGDPSRVQKWATPIVFTVSGEYTELDWATLMSLCTWLNTVEGFPGILEAENAWESNLDIHFCTGEEMVHILGDNFYGMDGGVTFWYDGMDQIYHATICCRNDIGQYTRNSIILEELYNGLGPVQDTALRKDSIIYSGFSEPQSPSEMDKLILQLLYHPDIRCGMNAEECEAVIRNLYY